jgi:hypothetical protein
MTSLVIGLDLTSLDGRTASNWGVTWRSTECAVLLHSAVCDVHSLRFGLYSVFFVTYSILSASTELQIIFRDFLRIKLKIMNGKLGVFEGVLNTNT